LGVFLVTKYRKIVRAAGADPGRFFSPLLHPPRSGLRDRPFAQLGPSSGQTARRSGQLGRRST